MKVLIVNPILYTSETSDIKRVPSIKDTMIYDLCLAFVEKGVDVTLATAWDFWPTEDEEYPFDSIWMKSKIKKICKPNVFPFCPEIGRIAKSGGYDLIISSEVFSINSLMLCLKSKENLIIWHELAKHNNMMHRIPSKIWYNIIAKIFFRNTFIVPRSIEARDFISAFCNNVSDTIVDHGVNLEKFEFCKEKKNHFIVCSQLIERKQIDKILHAFCDYTKTYDPSAKLYIIGEGDEEANLKSLAKSLGIEGNTVFTGKLSHSELMGYLKEAMALLVYTRKDNNMVSIVESIAVGTPVITTSVPYNAGYIKENRLGIVSDCWGADEMKAISDNSEYIDACKNYRSNLSTLQRVDTFTELYKKLTEQDAK